MWLWAKSSKAKTDLVHLKKETPFRAEVLKIYSVYESFDWGITNADTRAHLHRGTQWAKA